MSGPSDKGAVVLICDFCGKASMFVRHLIAGPQGAHICDECVDECAAIIAKARSADAAKEKA